MAIIYNSELSKGIVESARLQQNRDIIPNQLAEKVVPVMEVNPQILRKSKGIPLLLTGLVNTTSATIFTSDSIKKTYLTGATLSMIKDATSTATDMGIQFTNADSTVCKICRMAGITLTADSKENSITFDKPIEIKRGSNIVLTSDTNVANIVLRASLFGFEIDNSNA